MYFNSRDTCSEGYKRDNFEVTYRMLVWLSGTPAQRLRKSFMAFITAVAMEVGVVEWVNWWM